MSGTEIKLFNSVTKKPHKTFDVESNIINFSNEKLIERAKYLEWIEDGSNSIMIQDYDVNPSNIIYGYGRLTIEDINMHTPTFIGHQICRFQNTFQM